MNLANLIDGPSALIVFGGTALATVMRAGLSDCRMTLIKLGQLTGTAFDAAAIRAELAQQIQEIQQDGLLRAPTHHFADREFEEATDALISQRSTAALLAAHEAHRARRFGESDRAVRTLAQAAELAPVFGLAGTLVSLSQLPDGSAAQGSFTAAIAMAVITTLYGLLGANLLLAPLARAIERKAQAEEAERQDIIDWLTRHVTASLAHKTAQERTQRAAGRQP